MQKCVHVLVVWVQNYDRQNANAHSHPLADNITFPDKWAKHLIFITLVGE